MPFRILATAQRFNLDDKGATAIEYAFIASLVSIVILTALSLAGDNLTAIFNALGAAFV